MTIYCPVEVAYPREMQAAKQAEAEAKLRALAQVTQARGMKSNIYNIAIVIRLGNV